MSEAEFESQNNYFNLDSVLFRAAIETRKKNGTNLSAYISAGSYGGDRALSVGGRVAFDNGISLSPIIMLEKGIIPRRPFLFVPTINIVIASQSFIDSNTGRISLLKVNDTMRCSGI